MSGENEIGRVSDALSLDEEEGEEELSLARVPAPPSVSVASPEGGTLSTTQKQDLRDQFESDAASDLRDVRDALRNIIKRGQPKDQIAASKLILQVNGLLEKKQLMDSESVQQLVAAIMQRTPMKVIEGRYTVVEE